MRFAPRRRQESSEPPVDRVATRPLPRPVPDDHWPPAQPQPWERPPAEPGPPQPERRPLLGRRREQPPPEAPKPRRRRRLSLRIARVVVIAFLVQALLMLSLRWIDPPTTAFMVANPGDAIQQSVPVEHVSRNLLAAVIAHEDAELPYRDGAFDWIDMFSRATEHLRGGEDPSGSTIPQQVAKNIFLTAEPSALRKALEAGLSSELAMMVDDRRMLELYVNYAQFGPTIYGACAASWYYFDSPPSSLSVGEAVQLVGLLPSPGHVRRAPGGGLDFQVDDGLGWLSRSHVINAQNRVPRHLEEKGFTPVEDAGVEGLAQDQPASDDDCSEMPDDVAELIATEGTA
ncbi:glycosyl transferase [Blastococcus sp. CT_GayMR19]|nr:glycosyl transferase [Blastococcus sp. CT_GayMR19]